MLDTLRLVKRPHIDTCSALKMGKRQSLVRFCMGRMAIRLHVLKTCHTSAETKVMSEYSPAKRRIRFSEGEGVDLGQFWLKDVRGCGGIVVEDGIH